MNCPDWNAITERRAAEPLRDPDGFGAALAHLQGCQECRSSALATDPLLVFHPGVRPAPAVHATAAESAADVLAMQGSVLALVRASRVAGGGQQDSTSRLPAGFRIAASLALFSLMVLFGGPKEADREAARSQVGSNLADWIDETAQSADIARPVVEDLEQPGARIYELPQDDLAVVMIVDASLDV